MTNEAINVASRVDEIGFPEFTSKLVKDTFDTLVASQIDQVEAYAELVQETAKTLSKYINDTKDSISGEEIFAFVQSILPNLAPDKIKSGETSDTPLSDSSTDEVTKLNDAVAITDRDGNAVEPVTITSTSSSDAILKAVANRISANKYNVLLEIVRTGLIRLVVTDGVIESKLNFRTYDYEFARSRSSSYKRSSLGINANLRLKFGKVFRLNVSANYNQLKVSTSSSSAGSGSGTNINIQGMVRINFKSDYQALTAETTG